MPLALDAETAHETACRSLDKARSLSRFALAYAQDLPTSTYSLVRELAAAQAEWHLGAVWTLVWLLSKETKR
jgi:hypothetical protein